MIRPDARTNASAYLSDPDLTLYVGDALDVLRGLPAESVHCCVTSPPYWGLRDYGHAGQLGLEATPEEYVANMVAVFREVRRVLRRDGTCWLNLGDSYSHGGNGSRDAEKWPKQSRNDHRIEHRNTAGGKPKDLVGIPWRVAFALQADGWYLRSDIIWSKPNPMPESVTDRPTKAHEYLFLLSRSPRYWFDADAVREQSLTGDMRRPYGSEGGWQMDGDDRPREQRHGGELRKSDAAGANGRNVQATNSEAERRDIAGGTFSNNPRLRPETGRNVRSVWEIATQPYLDAHFAVFPEELPRRCILAGCPEGGTVLDPFLGSGTTALVARKLGRRSIGVELSADYARLAATRLQQLSLLGEATC